MSAKRKREVTHDICHYIKSVRYNIYLVNQINEEQFYIYYCEADQLRLDIRFCFQNVSKRLN